MRHLYSVLCHRAIVDSVTQKLSILDIPERLLMGENVDGQDANVRLVVNLTFVCVFWADKDEQAALPIRIVCKSPTGKEEEIRALEIRSPGKGSAARLLLNIQSISFRGFGQYEMQLDVQEKRGKREIWRREAAYPLVVEFSPEVASSVPQPPSGHSPAVPQK